MRRNAETLATVRMAGALLPAPLASSRGAFVATPSLSIEAIASPSHGPKSASIAGRCRAVSYGAALLASPNGSVVRRALSAECLIASPSRALSAERHTSLRGMSPSGQSAPQRIAGMSTEDCRGGTSLRDGGFSPSSSSSLQAPIAYSFRDRGGLTSRRALVAQHQRSTTTQDQPLLMTAEFGDSKIAIDGVAHGGSAEVAVATSGRCALVPAETPKQLWRELQQELRRELQGHKEQQKTSLRRVLLKQENQDMQESALVGALAELRSEVRLELDALEQKYAGVVAVPSCAICQAVQHQYLELSSEVRGALAHQQQQISSATIESLLRSHRLDHREGLEGILEATSASASAAANSAEAASASAADAFAAAERAVVANATVSTIASSLVESSQQRLDERRRATTITGSDTESMVVAAIAFAQKASESKFEELRYENDMALDEHAAILRRELDEGFQRNLGSASACVCAAATSAEAAAAEATKAAAAAEALVVQIARDRTANEDQILGSRTNTVAAPISSVIAAATAAAEEMAEGQVLELRREQRVALAGQAAMLRKEFEAAFRAEQVANSALARVAAVEQGLKVGAASSSLTDQNLVGLPCRLNDISSMIGGLDSRLARLETELRMSLAEQDQRIEGMGGLAQRSEERCMMVQSFDSRLARMETEVRRTLADQDERVEGCLAQSRRANRFLDAEHLSADAIQSLVRTTCASATEEMRARLLRELDHTASRLDVCCVERIRGVAADFAQQSLANRSLPYATREQHDEDLDKLWRSHEADMAKLRQLNLELSERLTEERAARTEQAKQFRRELGETVLVVQSQLEEWLGAFKKAHSESQLMLADHRGIERLSRPASSSVAADSLATLTTIAEDALMAAAVSTARATAADCMSAAAAEISSRVLSEARVEWGGDLSALRARLDDAVLQFQKCQRVTRAESQSLRDIADHIVDRALSEARAEWKTDMKVAVRSIIDKVEESASSEARRSTLRALESLDVTAQKLARATTVLAGPSSTAGRALAAT